METNQPQVQQKQSNSALTKSKTRLIDVLAKNDKNEVALYLSDFKDRGIINFERVLSVKSDERIPMLSKTKEGRNSLLIALSAALNSALENINLRVSLNEDQIVELADRIIDDSFEDNLAIEDVLLFLQELVTGKAGKIYDRMDIPTFFELFENYRQRRHEKLLTIRYEESVNHKALGPTDRSSEDLDKERQAHKEAISDHLRHMYKDKKQ